MYKKIYRFQKPSGSYVRRKSLVVAALLLTVFTASCATGNYLEYIFKKRITVQQAIDSKSQMDKSENPAYRLVQLKDLSQKRIKIENITVKDIIASTNIDYTFCVVVAVDTARGPIDCHVYANDLYQQEDIRTISKLIKNKTIINVDGDFKRFFSLLDETYTKIEIVNARITIED